MGALLNDRCLIQIFAFGLAVAVSNNAVQLRVPEPSFSPCKLLLGGGGRCRS